jgi:hypothetical protein
MVFCDKRLVGRVRLCLPPIHIQRVQPRFLESTLHRPDLESSLLDGASTSLAFKNFSHLSSRNVMASAYEYQSLENEPQGTIRLLKLLPGKTPKHISCQLQQATVDDDFTAISYVWGTDPPTERIIVNGQSFLVRQNLYQCLLHVRDQSLEKVLWIDAICVDQANLCERSSQVMLMDRIFGNAGVVVAWLGTNTADNDTLLKSTAVSKGYRVRSTEYRFESYSVLTDVNTSIFDSSATLFGDPGAATAAKNIVKDLLDRPYWTRMWVVQEVVLAKNLRLKYGNHQVNFDDLVYWAKTIVYWYRHCVHEFRTCIVAIDRSNILCTNFYRLCRQQGCSISVDILLKHYHDRACADPRDRIISLLGISPSFLDTKDRLNNANLYEMSESRLCEHVSRRYDCKYKDLLRVLDMSPKP